MPSKATIDKKFKRIEEINNEFNALKGKIENLAKRQHKLNEERDRIIRSLTVVTFPNPAASFSLSPNMTIGDAMENILRIIGTATQKELIKILNDAFVPISSKNAYVVLANLLIRDAKKRFVKMKDGRITLRKENE